MAEESKALDRWPIAEAAARAERKALRLKRRQTELHDIVASVKLDAARVVALRKHAFKSDEELAVLKLTEQEIALVRQWQEPKKAVAFAVESSAKLVEQEVRGQAEKQAVKINVENAKIILPAKSSDALPAPVIIDVEVAK